MDKKGQPGQIIHAPAPLNIILAVQQNVAPHKYRALRAYQRSRRVKVQQDQVPSPHRESIVHRKDDPARHSNPCQSTGKVGRRPLTTNHQAALKVLGYLYSTRSEGVTINRPLKIQLEAYTNASYGGLESQSQTGVILTLGQQPVYRVVLPTTGHRLPQHNRSGICGLLRRGQGPGLGEAIPTGAPAPEYQPPAPEYQPPAPEYQPPAPEYQPYLHAINRLRGSSELVENNEVHEEEPPYRASVPLSPPVSTTRVALHPWEREPCRSPNEIALNDSNQQLENDMDWDEWIRCFGGEAWWN